MTTAVSDFAFTRKSGRRTLAAGFPFFRFLLFLLFELFRAVEQTKPFFDHGLRVPQCGRHLIGVSRSSQILTTGCFLAGPLRGPDWAPCSGRKALLDLNQREAVPDGECCGRGAVGCQGRKACEDYVMKTCIPRPQALVLPGFRPLSLFPPVLHRCAVCTAGGTDTSPIPPPPPPSPPPPPPPRHPFLFILEIHLITPPPPPLPAPQLSPFCCC